MPALHDDQAAQPGPEAFEVLQGEDLRRYRAWRKRQREVLKFPACPKCGSNSQVWINQISGTLKCHRAECYVDISAAESAIKLADLLDESWPHSRAQIEQAAALMRVMANELQQFAALKKAIQDAEPVAAQHRFRRPEKTAPNWSAWQPCHVTHSPEWRVDDQGYEVEYRNLYTLKGVK